MAANATLTAATALGGDFGITGHQVVAAGGAWAGLLKGIRNECPVLAVRIVDVDGRLDMNQAADLIIREVESRDGELEVAVGPGRRRLVRHALLPATQAKGATLPAAGDVWVVTGGGAGRDSRGRSRAGPPFQFKPALAGLDSARCGRAGLARPICRVVAGLAHAGHDQARADGKDPLAAWKTIEKSIEIERNLRSFREAGCNVTYHACDISNWSELSSTLAKVRAASGPIRGILHGAGYEHAARLEKKKLEHVERTIAAKVEGAAGLMALTESDPVRFFLAFGSISGRMGGLGQADYSLANEMLAKQLDDWRGRHPQCGPQLFIGTPGMKWEWRPGPKADSRSKLSA